MELVGSLNLVKSQEKKFLATTAKRKTRRQGKPLTGVLCSRLFFLELVLADHSQGIRRSHSVLHILGSYTALYCPTPQRLGLAVALYECSCSVLGARQ